MKKGLALVMAFLMAVFCAQALAETVPDEAIHNAILTLAWEDGNGEFWAEGHVVLGTKKTGDTVKVYATAGCQEYEFLDGIFTDAGGGFQEPITITFLKTDGGYELQNILQPDDGEDYDASIKKMMPKSCITKMSKNSEANNAEITRQMIVQAQAYLVGIGRTEPVQDWRDRDLQLSGILTPASNQTISFSPPYPLWVTNTERLENGVRYVYTRTWAADADAAEGYTYTTPDGSSAVCDGKPGTETLTKSRYDNQQVVETITIHAEPFELTVTYQDDGGTKEYRFAYDGATYHQPTVTQTGECGVSYPSFEQSFDYLPQ
ncbi:MAG: hypothetical protein PHY64_04055 [Eubacteriales bacterium]|nr:hypothetical protein [Eubacteriales bacterium]